MLSSSWWPADREDKERQTLGQRHHPQCGEQWVKSTVGEFVYSV